MVSADLTLAARLILHATRTLANPHAKPCAPSHCPSAPPFPSSYPPYLPMEAFEDGWQLLCSPIPIALPRVPTRTVAQPFPSHCTPSLLTQLFKKLKKANNPDKIHTMVKEVTASLKEAKGCVLHHGAWGRGGGVGGCMVKECMGGGCIAICMITKCIGDAWLRIACRGSMRGTWT